MTAFIVCASAMLGLALLFLLPALLRKEPALTGPATALNQTLLQDHLSELDGDVQAGTLHTAAYRDARDDLERRLVEDMHAASPAIRNTAPGYRTALLLTLVIPIAAGLLYYALGAPKALETADPAAQNADLSKDSFAVLPKAPPAIEGIVDKLAAKLKSDPNDVAGWRLLAQAYEKMGRFDQAVEAYRNVIRLVPDDTEVLVNYAVTLAMTNNRSLAGEPEKLLDRALQIDPQNLEALALAGSAAFERKDYVKAMQPWKRILALVAPESDIAQAMKANIADAAALSKAQPSARQAIGSSTAAKGPDTSGPASASINGNTPPLLEGVVELAAQFRAGLSATDTVFIFARPAEGARFPLAVLRKQVKDLPFKFQLNDSMAMLPSAKISDFSSVVVGARVSRSGSATPSAGDIEGAAPPVPPGSKSIVVLIDTQRK